MEIPFPHVIEYAGKGPLTLSDIAESLLAQEALLSYLPKILDRTLPGIEVQQIKIILKELESGSLREEFLVSLFLAFQDDLKSEVIGGIEAVTGYDILQKYETVVTLLVILIALYGARLVYDKLRGKSAAPPASIQGDYNRVLNITAKNLHITPGALEQAVVASAASQATSTLTRATARFMRPAKKMEAGPIKAFDDEVISEGSVKEFPVEAELLQEETPMTPLPGVRLQILALDRMKRTSGWAARFPDKEYPQTRLTMDLYPTVDLQELRTAEYIRGDVIVEQKIGDDGKLRPSRIHLVRVVEVLE